MSTTVSRVIAATDFSPAAGLALHRAALLADAHGAELCVVHALERSGWLPAMADSAVLASLRDSLRAASTAALADALESLPAGLERRSLLLDEPLDQALPGLLRELPAQLMVMGAHGGGGWQDALLGSSVDRVLRQHRLPVLLVRNLPAGPYRRVGLAVDFSEASAAAASFALGLTPDATHLLFHASEAPFERSLALAGLPRDQVEAYRREATLEAMRELEAFAAGLGGAGAGVVPALRQGAAPQVLPEFIAEAGIDLLALGSTGLSRLERGLLGSVGRHAAASLPCDVMLSPPTR